MILPNTIYRSIQYWLPVCFTTRRILLTEENWANNLWIQALFVYMIKIRKSNMYFFKIDILHTVQVLNKQLSIPWKIPSKSKWLALSYVCVRIIWVRIYTALFVVFFTALHSRPKTNYPRPLATTYKHQAWILHGIPTYTYVHTYACMHFFGLRAVLMHGRNRNSLDQILYRYLFRFLFVVYLQKNVFSTRNLNS